MGNFGSSGGGTPLGSIIQSGSAALQAIVGRNAIGKAEEAQLGGQQDSNNFLKQQYGQTQQYLQPYRDAGPGALGQMQTMANQPFTMSNLTQDPGYQFRLQQGQQALDRAAASKGLGLSGAALKGAMDYNQGMASQEYGAAYGRNQNQFNRLGTMAQMGENAAGQGAQMSNAFGTNMANGIGELGQIKAAGTMAQYRNWQTQDSRAAGAWGGGGSSGAGQSGGFGMGNMDQRYTNMGSFGGGGNQNGYSAGGYDMPMYGNGDYGQSAVW